MEHANTKWENGRRVFDADGARRSWEKARVDEHGVVRWLSNGAVPFEDMLHDFETIGVIDAETRERSVEARARDTAAFVAEARKNPAPLSSEVMAEARAAFGPNVDLVNVVTGRRFRT